MKGLLQSYPPLGQVTIIQSREVILTAVLRVSLTQVEEEWEVALWISHDNKDWSEISLAKLAPHDEPHHLGHQPRSTSLLYFACSFRLQRSAQFTLKFRQASNKPWEWVRDKEGLNDGVVILLTPHSVSEDNVGPRIADLDTKWKISSPVSQSPGTRLWSLDCALPASPGRYTAARDIDVGTPWGSFLRWFALVQHKAAWLGPRHGKSQFNVDQDAILCCFLSHEGKTMAMLAISGIGNVTTTFRHNDQGMVTVHARNDSESIGTATVLVSEGNDFQNAVASVMYHARTMVSGPYATPKEQLTSRLDDDPRTTAAWKPEWYDGLGFCTWNALGQQLSEKTILAAVEELARNEIRITNLIIDDNWQSLDRSGGDQFEYSWVEFEADRKAFPNGLKGLVSQIRNIHPDIQHVFVWHALLGYWGGISPCGSIAETYETTRVSHEGENTDSLIVVVKPDVSRFYDDFYRFLADSGIDGVKADAQVQVDLLTTAADRRDLMSTYLDAWSEASKRYFGSQTISCMSQFPYALFYSQLPRNRREILVRNSDDFFPDVPRSHPWHMWANAHNAIFTQFLNAVPDWDMFQTAHDYSGFHAAARCVSGGPIYITDVPGDHNIRLLRQMTATTPLGQTVILRPSVLGKSVSAYASYEDDVLLKIGSYNGAAQTGIGILGVFNISTRDLVELIPLELFPGVSNAGKYVVRAHSTGKASMPMTVGGPEPFISISLEETGHEIYSAFPVTPFKGKGHDDGHVGVFGLVGKMTGGVAMTSSSMVQREDGRVVVTCNIKVLGALGVYISTLPQLDIEDDFMVAIESQPVSFETVRRSEDDIRMFEIDVEKAWEGMVSRSLQRNEVQVKVSFQP